MRFFLAGFGVLLAMGSAPAQTVQIYNLYSPWTALDVGDTLYIAIWDAAPNGTVTTIFNGGEPFTWDTTTDSGGYWGTTSVVTEANVASWTEEWYVNGDNLTVVNPNPIYLLYAPRLPSFTIYSNFTGQNCAAQSQSVSGCLTGNKPQHWVWSPVSYTSDSSLLDYSELEAVAGGWNSDQSKISLVDSTAQLDISVSDNSGLGTGYYGATTTYGQDCDSLCYNEVDICTGACLNSLAVYYVTIQLNPGEIENEAFYMGVTTETAAANTLAHEFGHALRLGHAEAPGGNTGICSEVQDIMYTGGGPAARYFCNVSGPTACDATGINGVYPTAVGYCTPGYNFCNGTACP